MASAEFNFGWDGEDGLEASVLILNFVLFQFESNVLKTFTQVNKLRVR